MKEFLAGAIAGTTVDVALFPLDSIKTRLQSKQGFYNAGGFKNIYRGLGSCVIGSAPSASLFFTTYEFLKRNDQNLMLAASLGEMSACLFRVPTEVIKQRMQVGMFPSLNSTFLDIMTRDGLLGLYRGYGMTIFREIPFACIQFPLYEGFKRKWAERIQRSLHTYEAAFCGFWAGAIAAALTTPFDVIKTRIMLSRKMGKQASINFICRELYQERGMRGFFSGIGPRVLWISFGGSIFLGTYEAVKSVFQD